MENQRGIEKLSTFNSVLEWAHQNTSLIWQNQEFLPGPNRSLRSNYFNSSEFFLIFYQKAKEAKLARTPQMDDKKLLKDLEEMID